MFGKGLLHTFFGALAAAFLIMSEAAAQAPDAVVQRLSGWWLAVDNVFPTLGKSGMFRPMDELMIIDPKGEIESRILFPTKRLASQQECVESGACSDAPLVARGRLRIDNDKRVVQFVERSATSAPIQGDKVDPVIRSLTALATESWRFSLAPNGNLVLNATSPSLIITEVSDQNIKFAAVDPSETPVTRTFVRVEPARLKRLIALFNELKRADDQWRCYLANATADDSSFYAIRTADASKPDRLDLYAKVASYLSALQAGYLISAPDDPDPKRSEYAKQAAGKIETFTIESFEDVPAPKTRAEAMRNFIKFLMISSYRDPDFTEQQRSDLLEKLSGDRVLSLGVTNEESAAYWAFVRDEAAINRMLCRK